MHLISVVLFTFYAVPFVLSAGLNEEFTWSRISFQWPEDSQLSSRFKQPRHRKTSENAPIFFDGETNAANVARRNSSNMPSQLSESMQVPSSIDYQYANNVPMGANVWKDKLFVTIPRRRLGVPSTLNYVPLSSAQKHNVPLIPYPSWNLNRFPDTSGSGENFVSVYRIAIDVCDRMWFVDTGIVETLGNRTTVKPHQIIIINLQTDEVIHRFSLPENVITPATILASVTIDTPKGSCGDAFAYFPDLAGYGLIVYSLRENRAWRVRHNYFYLEPMAGDFNIAGYSFQWNDGIFSVELTDIKSNGYRDLYFHPMAGTHMYKVSTRILRNEALATRTYHDDDFSIVGDRGPRSQTSTADIHKPTGTMFLALVNQNAVGCWNVNKDLKTLSVVAKDDQRMIYPSDVKIVGDKVYVLTNTMPRFLYGQLDYNVTNFRVWTNDVRSAIRGTQC
ncbi:hypothetical protein HUJ04_007712 [Dendroctonus ponderosae]